VAIAHRGRRQTVARFAFIVLALACIAPFAIRSLLTSPGPSVRVVMPDGDARTITLSDMKRLPVLTREGMAQNQYGLWRDQGLYSGTALTNLTAGIDFASIDVVAADGYRVTLEAWRVEDPEYPVVLAFGMDGIDVPEWEDGFRLVVLPVDGDVSNAEYGVESAGSYWVKRVVELVVRPATE
jgi:hypothetical protein